MTIKYLCGICNKDIENGPCGSGCPLYSAAGGLKVAAQARVQGEVTYWVMPANSPAYRYDAYGNPVTSPAAYISQNYTSSSKATVTPAAPAPEPDEYWDMRKRLLKTEHENGVDPDLLARMVACVTMTVPDMDKVTAEAWPRSMAEVRAEAARRAKGRYPGSLMFVHVVTVLVVIGICLMLATQW